MTDTHQETEGLLSPFVRDLRLRRVAAQIEPQSIVLDLACGNGFLGRFLPAGCRYFGVDRIPAAGGSFERFVLADLLSPETPQTLRETVGEDVDYITCAAFLEHIDDPAAFLRAYRPLLRESGQVVGTTPHPRGRRLHDTLASVYLCSRSGAAEHERFLSRSDLREIAGSAGGSLERFNTFLFGLNQLFVFSF